MEPIFKVRPNSCAVRSEATCMKLTSAMNQERIAFRSTSPQKDSEVKSSRVLITPEILQHFMYEQTDVQVVDSNGVKTDLDKKRSRITKSPYREGFRRFHQRKMVSSLSKLRVEETRGARRRLTYSVDSFPEVVQLCRSGVPGEGYGVCGKQHIPAGTWIGPYEGKRVKPDDVTMLTDTSYMWEIFHDGKLAYFLDGRDESCSSWMRFIRCARHKQEQNMFAFQYMGNIYYRAFKDIAAGAELLVWYDESYPQHMGIPLEVQETAAVNCTGPCETIPLVVPVLAPSRDIPLSKLREVPPHSQATDMVGVDGAHHQILPDDNTDDKGMKAKAPKVEALQERVTTQWTPSSHSVSQSDRFITNGKPTLQKDVKEAGSQRTKATDPQLGSKSSDSSSTVTVFQCGQCNKTFSQRSALQIHVCPRLAQNPFKCGYCSKAFAQPNELRSHAIIHTSEKPFKCGFCSRLFAGATTLNNHIRTHTGVRPFTCDKCEKTFSQASQLSRHQRFSENCLE